MDLSPVLIEHNAQEYDERHWWFVLVPVKGIPREELAVCVPILYSHLEDRMHDIRANSHKAILGIMIHVGYEAMLKQVEKLKVLWILLWLLFKYFFSLLHKSMLRKNWITNELIYRCNPTLLKSQQKKKKRL